MTLQKFINTYPNFTDCAIQTFDDNANRKKANLAQIFPASDVDRQAVKRLNDDGAWVFFSVNSMQKWERKKSSVTHLNTRIVECDTLSKKEQMQLIENAPTRPSCVIESKKSYHIYYFANDATPDNREIINRWLQQYYKGDPAICKDTARVLRLPWTLHQKNIDDPFTIKLLWINDIKYTEKDMMKHFPYTIPTEKTEKNILQTSIKKADNLREVMWQQSNKYMLERISNSKLVQGETIYFSLNSDGTEQIVVNNNAVGCWLDKNDMIGSTKGWWPTRIQRCTYYGNSKAEIAYRFVEFCSDLIPKNINRTQQVRQLNKIQEESDQENKKQKLKHIMHETKISKAYDELYNTNPEKVMKRWRTERDNVLWGIYWGKVYLVWADTWVWKSTFLNQVACNLAYQGTRVAKYSLEDRMEDIGKEEIFYMTNKYRKKNGKKMLHWVSFVNGEYTHKNWRLYSEEICEDIDYVSANMLIPNLIELDKKEDVWIHDMVDLMHEECDKGTQVFIIDHLHYFRFEDDKVRMDLQIENAMKAINEIARQRNVAVFVIAHYNSSISNWVITKNSFKGSSGIKQIANIIIQISREEGSDITEFYISKLRWPIKAPEFSAKFDLSTFEYSFTKTKKLIQWEKSIF